MTRRARASSVAKAGAEPSHGAARSKPQPASTLAPALYLVATPIGNAEDITLRALKTLAAADVIACEDTRVTAKLLALHGIERPLLSYHEHNAEHMRPIILDRLRRGERVALVSDAGTPLISDPGFKLVRAALAEGLPVTALPGPSAAVTALLVSGLPSDRFFFAGFLPPKAAARRTALAELGGIKASLVFFEGAPRLAAALADMAAVLGPRPAAVARELTKLYEEVRRGSLAELAAHYRAEGAPRGELAVVVGPPPAEAAPQGETLDRQIEAALARMSLRDACAAVAAATGLPRRTVYARALALAARE
ncbi:MAG TPA: 16S rRNA (cytidine(1402)-2'-O)-methyltransferase [Stellaceae bacterium]|nr:16S rRNA (cytidine(1402)-2'-O)-methyltransferase [Stellaceae bacterium]